MSVTFNDLWKYNPDLIRDPAGIMRDVAKACRDLAERHYDEVSSVILNGAWSGDAAESGLELTRFHAENLENSAVEADAIAEVGETYAELIQAQKDALDEIVESLDDWGLAVTFEGDVHGSDPPRFDPLTTGLLAMAFESAFGDVVDEADRLDVEMEQLLHAAGNMDEPPQSFNGDAAGTGASVSDPDQLTGDLEGFSSGEDPEAANDWWESLSAAEQDYLLREHPDLVGSTDGIPSHVRDEANRVVLDREIEALPEDDPTRETLEDIRDQLEAGYSDDRGYSEDYYLIDLDADAGHAVVSVGNPDTADNVSVYVPGTENTFDSTTSNMDKAGRMAADASFVSDEDTAAVMWLGYDAPTTDWDDLPLNEDHARAAGEDLDSYVDGLRATGQEDMSITAVGHSYGSTVIGVTDRDHGLDVDQMVFFGSPGLGVDHADDLSVGAENVYVAMTIGDPDDPTDNDPIAMFPPDFVLGANPYDDDFGANAYGVDGEGHSAYLAKDSVPGEYGGEARQILSLVATGQADLLK